MFGAGSLTIFRVHRSREIGSLGPRPEGRSCGWITLYTASDVARICSGDSETETSRIVPLHYKVLECNWQDLASAST